MDTTKRYTVLLREPDKLKLSFMADFRGCSESSIVRYLLNKEYHTMCSQNMIGEEDYKKNQ